ncbi:DUF6299 family protein [Streptomyces sp. NPDC048337]|uniref:DUF6299 family protein n=1 Tax=Streptomyces sp. NPDC048337 TaxID=3365535 RepID=UPI0037215374
MSGRRMALAALSALAATTVFTVPAGATVFEQGISVHPEAHIAKDGAVTLSGTYHCEQASPVGAMQIKATVEQDGSRLSIGAGEVVCDGTEREWVAHAPAFVRGSVHPGHATVTGELQEIHLSPNLMPRSVATVAQDTQDVEVHEER